MDKRSSFDSFPSFDRNFKWALGTIVFSVVMGFLGLVLILSAFVIYIMPWISSLVHHA